MKSISYEKGSVLSYTEYGDPRGFPILVQHGMIASIKDGQLFDTLAAMGARLVCAARPGYGQSSPYRLGSMAEWGEIVSILADELNLAHFDVLGMSSGAPYSYSIGHRLAGRVRNIFIFSGTPALYDGQILAHWPYPVNPSATLAEMQKLAFELFFAGLSPAELKKEDVCDSMNHECFGIAQDLLIRCQEWGFQLSQVSANVVMQHNRFDPSVPYITAQMTARLLPHCRLVVKENSAHFSAELLDEFFRAEVAPFFSSSSSV